MCSLSDVYPTQKELNPSTILSKARTAVERRPDGLKDSAALPVRQVPSPLNIEFIDPFNTEVPAHVG